MPLNDTQTAICRKCSALCASRSQIVFPTPCPEGGLLAIGEAPGADEDRVGEGFAGRAGKTLDGLLMTHDVRRQDYGRANAVWCRPEGNRKPTAEEVANCQPQLFAAVEEMKPKVLLLVGGSSVKAVLGSKRNLYEQIKVAPSTAVQIGAHACSAIPMPHVSPLAWNRFAPDGRKWSEIGRDQVKLAVSLLA